MWKHIVYSWPIPETQINYKQQVYYTRTSWSKINEISFQLYRHEENYLKQFIKLAVQVRRILLLTKSIRDLMNFPNKDVSLHELIPTLSRQTICTNKNLSVMKVNI